MQDLSSTFLIPRRYHLILCKDSGGLEGSSLNVGPFVRI